MVLLNKENDHTCIFIPQTWMKIGAVNKQKMMPDVVVTVSRAGNVNNVETTKAYIWHICNRIRTSALCRPHAPCLLAEVLQQQHELCLLTHAQRQLYRIRRQSIRRWQDDLAAQIASASEANDAHRVWWLSRVLGGRRIGPKGRLLNAAYPYRPSTHEWAEHLARSGGDGGCSASVVWNGTTAHLEQFWESYGFWETATPQSTGAVDRANCDLEVIVAYLNRKSRGRAVPSWSCPGDLWRVALQSDHIRHLLGRLIRLIRLT
jgi:hypothetical protein